MSASIINLMLTTKLGKREEREQPAWEDPDDQTVEVDLSAEARLRKVMRKHQKTKVDGSEYQELMKDQVMGRLAGLRYVQWAEQAADQTDAPQSQLDHLLVSDKFLGAESRPADVLEIRKVCENEHKDKLACVVQTLHAHPSNNQVFLAGGFDKTLRLFRIDYDKKFEAFDLKLGKSVFVKDFAIKCARFVGDEAVALSSIRQALAFYDIEKEKVLTLSSLFSFKGLEKQQAVIGGLEANRSCSLLAAYSEGALGSIALLSPKSKHSLFELSMNERCEALTFGRDNHELIGSGDRGNVYIWDLRKRAIVQKFKDYGSQACTAVASTRHHLLTGSKAGLVNLFDFNAGLQDKPEPVKRFDNLTTTVTQIKASGDGQRFLFSSKWKKGALKVADLASKTVYKNWPNFKTNLGIVSQAEFSSNSDYLIIGNDKGRIYVYKIGDGLDRLEDDAQEDAGGQDS